VIEECHGFNRRTGEREEDTFFSSFIDPVSISLAIHAAI